jgi:hypothetical protein
MAITDCESSPWPVYKDGYAQKRVDGATWLAHRWAWTRAHGPIPEGMCIDHICRNRACVNVDHLRVVTRGQNSVENSVGITAVNKVKTHCNHGHAFTHPNTRIWRGKRICKQCQANAHHRHRAIPEVKAKRALAAREARAR